MASAGAVLVLDQHFSIHGNTFSMDPPDYRVIIVETLSGNRAYEVRFILKDSDEPQSKVHFEKDPMLGLKWNSGKLTEDRQCFQIIRDFFVQTITEDYLKIQRGGIVYIKEDDTVTLIPPTPRPTLNEHYQGGPCVIVLPSEEDEREKELATLDLTPLSTQYSPPPAPVTEPLDAREQLSSPQKAPVAPVKISAELEQALINVPEYFDFQRSGSVESEKMWRHDIPQAAVSWRKNMSSCRASPEARAQIIMSLAIVVTQLSIKSLKVVSVKSGSCGTYTVRVAIKTTAEPGSAAADEINLTFENGNNICKITVPLAAKADITYEITHNILQTKDTKITQLIEEIEKGIQKDNQFSDGVENCLYGGLRDEEASATPFTDQTKEMLKNAPYVDGADPAQKKGSALDEDW